MPYYAQEAETGIFFWQLNVPYLFSSFGCFFTIRAPFLALFSLANSVSPPSSLSPPICEYNYCHCQLCLPSAFRLLRSCNHRIFWNIFIQIKDVQLLSRVYLVLRKMQVSWQRLSEPTACRERLQEVSLPSLAILACSRRAGLSWNNLINCARLFAV